MVVSRCFVMPMAATSFGRTWARPSASTATPICDAQISCGSCSTHPGDGNICLNSFCAIARIAPSRSKRMARELCVPWPSARMYGMVTCSRVRVQPDESTIRAMSNALSRELLAEFFGTFILIVFGVGVVAQVVLSKNAAGSTLSINIAWGLAVTMGCYAAAGVTGAHLNPAVTLALAVHRRFPWNKVLPY